MPPLFRSAQSRPVWLAVLLLAALGLYLADARLHLLEGFRGGLLTLIAPLQRAVALPGQVWMDTQESMKSRNALELENQQLKAERTLLQAQMQTFWSVEQENKRLRTALKATAALDMDVMLVRVLRNAKAANNPTILIDRGVRDGVYVGQAALLGAGVFGQVVHVGATTAEVMPLTDDQHAIPVRVARSGQRGIVRGAGSPDELEVHHFPKQADVIVGDVLLTSGLGGGFPEGFPVASVTHISSEQSGAFADIRARPMAELHDVRDMVLVWMRESEAAPPTLSERGASSDKLAPNAAPPPSAAQNAVEKLKTPPAHAQ